MPRSSATSAVGDSCSTRPSATARSGGRCSCWRPLELDGRAVASIAADLDDPGRRATLVTGLRELDGVVAGLPALEASLAELVADPARAWESYALSLLAGALGEDDDDA